MQIGCLQVVRLVRKGWKPDGKRVQHLSIISGIGLKHALLVHKKSITFRVQLHGSNQFINLVSIYCGTEGPGPSAFDYPLHGHNHVRKFSKTHEDIADVGTPHSNLMKPGLPAVVAALEFVRPHVTHLHTVFIYQAKVYKAAELLFHNTKNPVQVSLVSQFLKRMLRSDKTYGRKPFGQGTAPWNACSCSPGREAD